MEKMNIGGIRLRKIFSKRTFYLLATTFFILLFSYAYLLTNITIKTAEAKKIDSEIKELMSDVATLEVEYLAAVSGLDMNKVVELGYAEIKNVKFAYTKEAKKSIVVLAE